MSGAVRVRAGKTGSILSSLESGKSVQILPAHLNDDADDLIESIDQGLEMDWERIPWVEIERDIDALWQIALILTKRLVSRPNSEANRTRNEACAKSVISVLNKIALSCEFSRNKPVAQFFVDRLTEVSKVADLAAKLAELLSIEIVEYEEDFDVHRKGIARYNYAAMLACLGAPGVPALSNYFLTYRVRIDKALELMRNAEQRTADTDPRKKALTDARQKLAESFEGLQRLADRTA